MDSSEETGIEYGAIGAVAAIALIGGIVLLVVRNRDSFNSEYAKYPYAFLAFVANLMPFALLAYGIAGDTVNQEFRLSIPSIAAFASILVVGLGSQMFASKNQVDLSDQDTSGTLWCTIPGLEGFESPYFPTAFISTAIIAIYYICWTLHSSKSITTPLLVFGIIFVAQFGTFIVGDCVSSYKPLFGSIVFNIFSSIGIGSIIGLITYFSTFSNPQLNPYNLPGGSSSGASGGGNTGAGVCPAGTTAVGNNLCKSSTGGSPVCESGFIMRRGKCEKQLTGGGHSYPVQGGGDENTFVAELYKNGQLVTDSIAG